MNWSSDGPTALSSSCGRYTISRADVGRRGLVYTAVRLGSPSAILGQRTVSDERAAREAAVAQLQSICEEHAGGV